MIHTDRPPISRMSSLLGTPSHSAIRVLGKDEIEGYNFEHTQFDGLRKQMKEVANSLQGLIPSERIDAEVEWFYTSLDIDYSYFANDTIENIRSYILSLWSAKLASHARGSNQDFPNGERLLFDRQYEDHAVFFDTTIPGKPEYSEYERVIDQKYVAPSNSAKAFRVESFRCPDVSSVYGTLRCYFVGQCQFSHQEVSPSETSLSKIADRNFLNRASEHTKQIYEELIKKAVNRTGPVTEIFEIANVEEGRLVVAYRQGTAPGFFKALSDLYHFYNLTSSRKYVDQFANGITVVCVYLKPIPNGGTRHAPTFKQAMFQVLYECSLLYCLPNSEFSSELAQGKMSLQEAVYAHCAFVFVSRFLNRLGPEYSSLMKLLDMSNSANSALMLRLKRRLRGTSFTGEYISELLRNRLDIVKILYLHFAGIHYVPLNYEFESTATDDSSQDSEKLNYQRFFWSRSPEEIPTTEELQATISKLTSEDEATIFEAVLTFNKHVLKTNFFTPTKVAISFRLEPSFLPRVEYPEPLFGMFLVVGQEFFGFHLRFRDVARGGIRIVKSRNKEAHAINARQLFDENYNLANTQQRKNKDIPEGGSKGVILLNAENQDCATQSFQKYIDSIIDLLIPGNSPGIKEAIADYYGENEILFMGPDENTAGLVDWATQHAKGRGAPWWKSFFTGKSPQVGGIPHDEYGMTSLSVREYVKGIYRKLNLEDKVVNKLQTGGPDGDLGSNEILLSTPNERYIAIVDGSGVLADPAGLDKADLRRLASERKMIADYDSSLLSSEGYKVLVEDSNVKLPNGELVDNGVAFRNSYHLKAAKLHKIDIFVPCGGRPEAINAGNVSELIDEKSGKTLIPFIVEGANLFLSQSAKLELEDAGAIIYKDASANKGGVTSSSLEVLASLAFDDEGFFKNMCLSTTSGAQAPEFYKEYVKDVQERIKLNARLEFEAIWRDAEITKKPRSVLSDDLSRAINTLGDDLSSSTLWEDVEFRNSILRDALPETLVKTLGLNTILKNVPVAYLDAIFASYLAGRYIYEKGCNANQFAFYEFMTRQRAQAKVLESKA